MARPMEIDILIENDAWDEAALEAAARAAFEATLDALGLDPAGFCVSILACGDDRIAALNAEFRGKPTPTNVLSWPSEERGAQTPGAMPDLPEADRDGPPEELGDIALAHGVLTREAVEAGKPFEHHLTHLLVHGLLHLLGFDHITDPDAGLMEGLETRILARLGLPDPY
ncbi:putative rRNA maturation factor [Roseicyclus mahoneyensis]|uniref:Endoribonuclease YbeY n=2 Tax=Roseicyclus mahoneyensis TaxID=164332 RepID=A0A316GF43_9RHOB|nr:putative rRNA maturation factor [Roseicyclus mahoneyensis]